MRVTFTLVLVCGVIVGSFQQISDDSEKVFYPEDHHHYHYHDHHHHHHEDEDVVEEFRNNSISEEVDFLFEV